jgi:hypothetical protein
MPKFLFPLGEYNRIYQVAHGVLKGVPEAAAEKACLFFASFGGYVLNQSYKINARVVGGAFTICLGEGDVAVFGKLEEGQLESGPDAFHMWLQTETHIVDFMAPIYREAFIGQHAAVPRKMMQRQLKEEAASPDVLKGPGDFRYYPNPELTDQLLNGFLGRRVNADLLNVAIAWYGKHRSKQASTFAMRDENGEVSRLSLPDTIALGSW